MSTQTAAEVWIKSRSWRIWVMSSNKTRGSGPRDRTGSHLAFSSAETKDFWIRGPENPVRRQEEAQPLVCVEGKASQASASFSPTLRLPPPCPLILHPQSSLLRWCAPWRHSLVLSSVTEEAILLCPVACPDPSPSLCLGQGSHSPSRSLRLHFRNYSRRSHEAENGRRGRSDKRGPQWLAVRPNSCCSPWFCAGKSVPTVVPSQPSCFLSFLPPSRSHLPTSGNSVYWPPPPPPPPSNNKRRLDLNAR